MKKISALAMILSLSTSAISYAQTSTDQQGIDKDKADVHRTILEEKKDRKENGGEFNDMHKDHGDAAAAKLRRDADLKNGDKAAAAKEQAEIDADKKQIMRDRKVVDSNNADIKTDKGTIATDTKDMREHKKELDANKAK